MASASAVVPRASRELSFRGSGALSPLRPLMGFAYPSLRRLNPARPAVSSFWLADQTPERIGRVAGVALLRRPQESSLE